MIRRFVWDKNQEKVVPIEERTDKPSDVRNLNPFCYDRVDAVGETRALLSKMEDAGRFKNPADRKRANDLMRRLESKPQQIVDYQKTGYPWGNE